MFCVCWDALHNDAYTHELQILDDSSNYKNID